MSVSFEDLITACLMALGDGDASTWSRTNIMLPWCIEAIRTFPILRPMQYDYSDLLITTYEIELPADFREVISVEYPTAQTPPQFCLRKNRLDPNFYDEKNYYDIDHDYSTGSGWILYMSTSIAAHSHVFVEYLANHDTAMTDSSECLITIPDEYEGILIASVMCRAYRERLGVMMQDPTAHSSVIMQMTDMVNKAEENFRRMVSEAQNRLTNSVVTSNKRVDKYDRVY
jgi:hypothetical protein